jgi:putative FmdB family regulatory protein
MPTYVYACDACGKQFEKFQSFKDDPLTSCPCGQEGKVRRVIQPAGIVFKGSGWYITDSRGSSSSSVTSDTATPPAATADASTSAEPATKAEAPAPAPAPTSEKSVSNVAPAANA